jgi:hypothetical protein
VLVDKKLKEKALSSKKQDEVLENQFKKRCINHVRKDGWALKYYGGRHTLAGIPDLLCCIEGFFIAIELKRKKGGTPRVLQDKCLEEIRTRGKGKAFVCYGWDDFLIKYNKIKSLLKGTRTEDINDK